MFTPTIIGERPSILALGSAWRVSRVFRFGDALDVGLGDRFLLLFQTRRDNRCPKDDSEDNSNKDPDEDIAHDD